MHGYLKRNLFLTDSSLKIYFYIKHYSNQSLIMQPTSGILEGLILRYNVRLVGFQSDSPVPFLRMNVTRQGIVLGRKGLSHSQSVGGSRDDGKVIGEAWKLRAATICCRSPQRCLSPPHPGDGAIEDRMRGRKPDHVAGPSSDCPSATSRPRMPRISPKFVP